MLTDRGRVIAARLEQAGLPVGVRDRFVMYDALLAQANQRMNLTAITQPMEVAEKHFLDSLLPVLPVPSSPGASLTLQGSVIDVGSGAGFPGIPLLIWQPELDMTLLDALDKRCGFLREVLAALGLRAQVVHMRAEDWARQQRQVYDVSVSRAVSELRVLAEYQLPLVKVGGCCWCYKGQGETELLQAENALRTLGAERWEIIPLGSTSGDARRTLIRVWKGQNTPSIYPRRAGKPEKSPL